MFAAVHIAGDFELSVRQAEVAKKSYNEVNDWRYTKTEVISGEVCSLLEQGPSNIERAAEESRSFSVK